MIRKAFCLSLVAVMPVIAQAEVDNVGTCGWGSKLFEGNRGIAPQVLAVTVNGTSGNQTFGISSGTSGCTHDGVVHSNWRMSLYTQENKDKLARDMSQGGGEALESLADLIGVEQNDRPVFFRSTRENFSTIFTSADSSADSILANLRTVMSNDAQLARYARSI